MTKLNIKKPWLLNYSQWLSAHNVHEPWIAEISSYQYGKLSKRARTAYDRRRSIDWDAAATSKGKFRTAIRAAYKAGKFTIEDPNISTDARDTIHGQQIIEQKAAASEVFEKKRSSNEITDLSDLKIGDRIFSFLVGGYAIITKINPKSILVKTKRGGIMKVKLGMLQWLSHSDLQAAG